MFKLFSFILFVCLISQTTQLSISDGEVDLKELDRQLRENDVSLEEFFNGAMNDEAGQLHHREPDVSFNAKQMIEYRGFDYESHEVVTQDCYILTLHRIVNPIDKTPNKKPILLQHGLADTSATWMINNLGGHIGDSDDRNLAFALAKRGYDVWLGNHRGNFYSKKHTTYTPKDSHFWKFTYDNHALQDLPAQIAYIQKTTNYDQIGYVGHSQGTMTMFQLLSFKPEVAKAIKPYIALAPVVHLGAANSPMRFLARKPMMRRLVHINKEFLEDSPLNRFLSDIACRAFPGLVCKNFLYLVFGFSDRQLNSTRMPVYFNHWPAGTSLTNVLHYGQNYDSKQFTMLDYMSDRTNLECYKRVSPPRVPLEDIVIEDLYLLNSENDLFVSSKDLQRLKDTLKVNFSSKTVDLKLFGHMDFLYSMQSDVLVNQHVIDVLKEKSPSMSVADDKKVRLREHTSKTCQLSSRSSRCHMDLPTVLDSII